MRKINHKYMQRKSSRFLQNLGVGIKAQRVVELTQEQGKLDRKKPKRCLKLFKFLLRQINRKQKHRGH